MNLHNSVAALLFLILTASPLFTWAQERQPELLLGSGDSIRVVVYQNADLTIETRINENGMINFPLIGVIRLGGKSIASAELAIANALQSGGFIKQPSVIISLLQNRSSQVSVLGQVTRPGRYPLESANTRLSEMLAVAGGVSSAGADSIILSGVRDGKSFRLEVDIVAFFLDGKLQDDPLLSAGDLVYVHRAPSFYIYGEVQRPGSYRVERNMTIRQALVQGGGPTLRGSERRVTLHRRGASGVNETSPHLNNLVRPDDVIYVGESLF